MSGDDHGHQRVSQIHVTEATETADKAIPQFVTPGNDVTSDFVESSIPSHTVREPSSPEIAGGSNAHLGEGNADQPAKYMTGRNWEDTSDSVPDDLPSVQGSAFGSPRSSLRASQNSSFRASRSNSLQPFDRRFQSYLLSSRVNHARGSSPTLIENHSRQSSVSSQLPYSSKEDASKKPPWEVVKWTKLRNITEQAFSERGKRSLGRCICLAVGASIVVGTSKGLILVFDYNQSLKSIVGLGTKAIESGSVVSIALSADHMAVAGGHSSGDIFVWQLESPKTPFLHIPPIDRVQVVDNKVNGHINGSAVLHVGFLGTRQTSLVSADDKGMAFSHSASRGLGSLGRSVSTTRILGRYQPINIATAKPRKPSSILALAPLPLGNVERATDLLGLTAILTPYLLVIVSTTPIAQTQHKAPRPKDLAPHSALSGCLAWFPAVKLKVKTTETTQPVSRSKLVYCWSNILTILEIGEPDYEDVQGKEASTFLSFQARSRWRSPEAIVAVQWLSRSCIGILTISQRLLILEDNTLRTTDSCDLVHKHIFHQDRFSEQLQQVVDQLEHDDLGLHGVVADAFYMSFRAYKGRILLLGLNDVTVGTLSNWADRLMALMNEGDVMSAIHLATTYYDGKGDKVTVGLPNDDGLRQALVKDKILGIIIAASKFLLGKFYEEDNENVTTEEIKELSKVTLASVISMNEIDFFFDEVYDLYGDSLQGVALEAIGAHIQEGDISLLPPDVLKELITHYAEMGYASSLEDIVCRLDTSNMDIHQITELCKKHNLYDALIYVWNQALRDYITPLIELLNVIQNHEDSEDHVSGDSLISAKRIFPYLAYTLTGRRYPDGEALSNSDAIKAKHDVYAFLLSSKPVEWPKGSGVVYLAEAQQEPKPLYPYLRLILHFDTSSFMSMLNEAFEDNFLNGESDTNYNDLSAHDKSNSQASGLAPTRQYIISVLLDTMFSGDFDNEDTIYLDMFIARNLPKFPQFILLSDSSVTKVLADLCRYTVDDVAEECQLSVEYLLSVYRSPDVDSLIPLFEEARFYRVLKAIYRREKRYADLLRTCFDDQADTTAVFECIDLLLRPAAGLTRKQLQDVEEIIVSHAQILVELDPTQTAKLIGNYSKEMLLKLLNNLEDESLYQFTLLQPSLEPGQDDSGDMMKPVDVGSKMIEKYMRMMCKFNPTHVADYVDGLKSGDLQLGEVLPAIEKSGLIDAAVVLMAREGLVRNAMQKLVAHMNMLANALKGLLDAASDSPDAVSTKEAAEDLLQVLDKNCKVGIWLCRGQTGNIKKEKRSENVRRSTVQSEESDLAPFELLWLDLLDATVSTSTAIADITARSKDGDTVGNDAIDQVSVMKRLRTLVQQTFTALLVATSTASELDREKSSKHSHPTFLRILRAFLTRTSRATPLLSDLRTILADIFSAYTFEETILSIANHFLDNDLYLHVVEAKELRERGWRSRSQTCELCKRRAWGLGAGGDIWDVWRRKLKADEASRSRARIAKGGGEAARRLARGKSKADSHDLSTAGISEGVRRTSAEDSISATEENETGSLVLFACRHMFHRRCLAQATERQENGVRDEHGASQTQASGLRCPIC